MRGLLDEEEGDAEETSKLVNHAVEKSEVLDQAHEDDGQVEVVDGRIVAQVVEHIKSKDNIEHILFHIEPRESNLSSRGNVKEASHVGLEKTQSREEQACIVFEVP